MTEIADLEAQGHNGGGRCEKCWREAGVRYAHGQGPYDSHNDAYYAVMAEAEDEHRAQATEAP